VAKVFWVLAIGPNTSKHVLEKNVYVLQGVWEELFNSYNLATSKKALGGIVILLPGLW